MKVELTTVELKALELKNINNFHKSAMHLQQYEKVVLVQIVQIVFNALPLTGICIDN